MRKALSAITPKRAAATVGVCAALLAGAAPAVATVTASSAPTAALAMTYNGPHSDMTYN